MRTTVTLAPDVAAEVRRRREAGEGPSEVINDLARRGLAGSAAPRGEYRQRTAALGARIDVSNVGEVLDLLDAED